MEPALEALQGKDLNQCHKCSCELKHALYCDACDQIQALGQGENYFSIFKISPSYKIDREQIEDAFDELVIQMHPDFKSDPKEVALAQECTALLHEAKSALFDPFLRGRYLLTLIDPMLGEVIAQPSQAFILETFELQEELDEVEKGADPTEVGKKIETLLSETKQKLHENFGKILLKNKDEVLTKSIQEDLAKLKFILNLETRLAQATE